MTIRLTKDGELGHRFTQPSQAYELHDGRVVIADPRERTVAIYDFSAAGGVMIGAVGHGPHEYSIPIAVLRGNPDSAVIFDLAGRKLLGVDQHGTITSSVSIPDVLVQTSPDALDSAGDVYFEEQPIDVNSGVPRNSVRILKWNPRTSSVATIARLDASDVELSHKQTGTRTEQTEVTMITRSPFSVRDEWDIAGGGTIVVLRGAPVRIELIDMRGRRIYRSDTLELPRARASHKDLRAVPVDLRDREFRGGLEPALVDGTARGSPDGHLWVQLHASASAQTTEFAVVGVRCRCLIGTASTDTSERLLSLGRDAAYFASTDSLGLVTVSRFHVEYP